jgi:hypothetical protein
VTESSESSNTAPFFIVGCARSGTTLIVNLLRSHPRIAIPDESHFIPSLYRGFGDPGSETEVRRLAGRILGNMWIKRWRLELTPDDFADCRSFRGVVNRLHGTWAEKAGKPRWGDKTPHYLTEIPTLLELFPEAKIIHIYRDGRDVALSWMRTRMEPRNIFVAARYWADRVTEGRRVGRSLPPGKYLEVRYETLLSETRATMMRVCDFLGEEFCEEVLAPTFVDLGPMFGFKRRKKDIRRIQVVTDNANKWRTAMSERDRILFESVAGELLDELGYEASGPRRRITAIERLWWWIHHWTLYIVTRLTKKRLSDRIRSFLLLKMASVGVRLPGRDSKRTADATRSESGRLG